jgi:hypothetical protein
LLEEGVLAGCASFDALGGSIAKEEGIVRAVAADGK